MKYFKNTIKTFFIISLFISLLNSAQAAPPEYVSDPDCTMRGIVKSFIFEEVDRETEHYNECQKPYPMVTDCEWIGEDGYSLNFEVTDVFNDQSTEDDLTCKKIYSDNYQGRFFISEKLFLDKKIKEGDIIFGIVARGGEFISVDVVDAETLSFSEKISHFLNNNKIFIITSFFTIIVLLTYLLFKRLK